MPRRPQDSDVAREMADGIGDRLRVLRDRRSWTQQEVAARIDLSTESYARIERGQSLPSFPTLKRLADTFETTAGTLLGDETRGIAEDESSGYELPSSGEQRERRRARLRKVRRRNPREPNEPEVQRVRRRRAATLVIPSQRRVQDSGESSHNGREPSPMSGVRRVTRDTLVEDIGAELDVLDIPDLRAVRSLVRHLAERQAEVFERLEQAERRTDEGVDPGPK